MSGWWAPAAVDWLRLGLMLGGTLGLWVVCGWARLRGALASTDARKINHVAAFVGPPAFCLGAPDATSRATIFLFGVLVVGLAVLSALRAERWPWRLFVAANSRSEDWPHETFYFWSSWLVSFAAILVVDAWTADTGLVRFVALAVGLGDGLAEPVGKRWGRTRYRALRWPGQKPATKSVEGSLAVCAGVAVAGLVCLGGAGLSGLALLVVALLLGLVAAVIEAMSPHGWDNATLPILLATAVQPLRAIL